MTNSNQLDQLYAARPRSRFVRWSLLIAAVVIATSWLTGGFHIADIFSARRLENLERFLEMARPYALQDSGFTGTGVTTWFAKLMWERGWSAVGMTLGISVVAIVLAGLFAAPLSLLAARNVATADPWSGTSPPDHRSTTVWWMLVLVVRGLLIGARAVPEYVWAFLLIGAIGPSAWPAVLALAIHNAGILGKLWSENVENIDPAIPQTLRAHGQSRLQVVVFGIVPTVLPRALLYFFYRWETCVREATVLGMLGIVSLGLWIREARARDWYDEMLVFMFLGALLVVAGDIVSWFARRQVRRA